ncbi:MAG: META domain-containing protein [Rhodanobacteraceae bacterium]|nr:META domain-containing protein [Rhodanobacteraceae bacterium]
MSLEKRSTEVSRFKLIAMFIAGLAAGCSNAPMSPVVDGDADTDPRRNTSAPTAAPDGAWHWLGTQAGAALWVIDEPARYRMEFAGDSQLQLQVDCNRGSAGYTLSADGLFQAGPVGLTKMGCGDASHDRDFVGQLAQARRLSFDGEWLQLALGGEGGVMLYARDSSLRLHAYQCEEGGAFAAVYGGSSAAVLVDGSVHVLPQVTAASGTHYRSGAIELRAKGDQATLSGVGRERRGCRFGD